MILYQIRALTKREINKHLPEAHPVVVFNFDEKEVKIITNSIIDEKRIIETVKNEDLHGFRIENTVINRDYYNKFFKDKTNQYYEDHYDIRQAVLFLKKLQGHTKYFSKEFVKK